MLIRKRKLIFLILFAVIVSLVFYQETKVGLRIKHKSLLKKTANLGQRKTEVIKYQQLYVPKESKRGYCWTSSIAAPANNKAWRCATEEELIFDPCFETESHQIVCNIDPENTESGFELKLNKSLPEIEKASSLTNEYSPWLVKLKNGMTCIAMSGNAGYIEGKSYYYFCDNNAVLLTKESEDLQKTTYETFDKNGDFWKVKLAFLDNELGKIIKVEEVEVTRVWR